MTAPPLRTAALPRERHYLLHDHLIGRTFSGPFDDYSRHQVLDLLTTMPEWPARPHDQTERLNSAGSVLDWLLAHPGPGWRDRWLAAGGDTSPKGWLAHARADDPRITTTVRQAGITALSSLMLAKVILPGYGYFSACTARTVYDQALARQDPELVARIRSSALTGRQSERAQRASWNALAKIVLHTGRELELLTEEDLFEYRACAIVEAETQPVGIHGAWDLLAAGRILPRESSLRAALRPGQKSAAELIDRYQLQCRPVRNLLIRYLEECKAAVDYTTLRSLAGVLGGIFWADLERHHPGIDSLRLAPETVTAWKERLAVVTTADGRTRERQGTLSVMLTVRCLYLDLRDWALSDPTLDPWAMPSPIKASDVAGLAKRKARSRSQIHQRIRERLPLLPEIVNQLEDQLRVAHEILAKAQICALGDCFDHGGRTYRRIVGRFRRGSQHTSYALEIVGTGECFSAAKAEDEAFWTWAVVETLRHSGLRIEELLELTHLALVSYQLSSTGETVPLLQVVPSKTNEERLLLVTPELASVLASVISRLRRENAGTVPLVARYDDYEATTGPRLPHLFQRHHGGVPAVVSPTMARQMLNQAIAKMGFTNRAGEPLSITPHDYRRMFSTDAVKSGLPLHIVSRLLGHKHLNSTQPYVAVFDEDLVRSYRAHVDRARATRPPEEYRQPTEAEWEEFEEHFQLRKVELGSCARPYGTGCEHEHACIRCPVLRVEPRQRQRLADIAANLELRIAEAISHGWAGEVQQLEISLRAAQDKLALSAPPAGQPVLLGLPVLRSPAEPLRSAAHQ